jgi:hypothetical protein
MTISQYLIFVYTVMVIRVANKKYIYIYKYMEYIITYDIVVIS